MEKLNLNGQDSVATSANEMIDFTEFVKELGRKYGEMNYEYTESPEDLQCTIDWADVNFFESDSLNWMLGEDSDYEEIAGIFDDMDGKEYRKYEHIFVDAAKERMEECLSDWKNNLAVEIEGDAAVKIATATDNFFDSVKCYGITSYDQIEEIEDLGTKQYALERVKDALTDIDWLANSMFAKIADVYGVDSVGPDDAFAVSLPIMKFFGFNESEYDYDNMSYCMDYLEEKYVEVNEILGEVEYEISSKHTITA